MAILTVVSLPVNVMIDLIQFALKPGTFAQREDAAGMPGARFGQADEGQIFQPTFLYTTFLVLPCAARRGKRVRYGGARDESQRRGRRLKKD